jgi:hypothetical protein
MVKKALAVSFSFCSALGPKTAKLILEEWPNLSKMVIIDRFKTAKIMEEGEGGIEDRRDSGRSGACNTHGDLENRLDPWLIP